MPSQPSCVVGHIIRTVVAVTACTAYMLHFNLLHINTQRKRQIFAQRKNALRVTPHFQTTAGLIRFPNSQSHTGPHRAMVQSRSEVNRFVDLGVLACFMKLTCFVKHLRVHRRGPLDQINATLKAIWQCRHIPLQQSLQLAGSLLRQFFSGRNNPHQRAIPKRLNLFRQPSQSIRPAFSAQSTAQPWTPNHPSIKQIFNWGQININSKVVKKDRLTLHECFNVIAAFGQRQGCGLGGHCDVDRQLHIYV